MKQEQIIKIIIENIRKQMREHEGVLVVALDGMSGVGKTTIANAVAKELDAVNVTTDDFFVGGRNEEWAPKSNEDKINAVIDWQRIKREVVQPLKAQQAAQWHPFNWKAYKGLSDKWIKSEPKNLVILDGAMSNLPTMRGITDYKILITAQQDARVGRVVEREGQDYSDDWHNVWAEAMEYYFTQISPPETFDLIIEAN